MAYSTEQRSKNELPSSKDATARLAVHELTCRPLGWRNLEVGPGSCWQRVKKWLTALWLLYHPSRGLEPSYPLLMGYADLLVVPTLALPEFCHLCGVFAAMGIFVECAAVTALALAVPRLSLERDLDVRGLELWSDADRATLYNQYAGRFSELVEKFPDGCLYVHPVKLSHWDLQN